jgi:hypothetical protein
METLIKAFPAPNLRCEATFSTANSCASAGGIREILIKSVFPYIKLSMNVEEYYKIKDLGEDMDCFENLAVSHKEKLKIGNFYATI